MSVYSRYLYKVMISKTLLYIRIITIFEGGGGGARGNSGHTSNFSLIAGIVSRSLSLPHPNRPVTEYKLPKKKIWDEWRTAAQSLCRSSFFLDREGSFVVTRKKKPHQWHSFPPPGRPFLFTLFWEKKKQKKDN